VQLVSIIQNYVYDSLIMTAQYPIERLNGSNYLNWELRVRTSLIKDDLFDVIDGTFPKPPNNGPAASKWRKMNQNVTVVPLRLGVT
jgi:hypothetical protein